LTDARATSTLVATASYRLLPHIDILSPIPPEHAAKFQACFPPGVVDLEYDDETGEQTKVVVKNPRLDTVSREVLRYPEFRDRVKLGRVRDHFICKSRDDEIRQPRSEKGGRD
jgi:DNA-directed RNA polymerase I and III subunit RPAC1